MIKSSTIRSLFALVMLLIFSFSITPKRYLHDLFVGHKDFVSKSSGDGKLHISQSGFNCDCNTLVATSPYTDHSEQIKVKAPEDFPLVFVVLTTPVLTPSYSFVELRGPPSLG